MTNPMIPTEAVEAAARVLADSIGKGVGLYEMHSWKTQDAYRKHARLALEAAVPYLSRMNVEEPRDWEPGDPIE